MIGLFDVRVAPGMSIATRHVSISLTSISCWLVALSVAGPRWFLMAQRSWSSTFARSGVPQAALRLKLRQGTQGAATRAVGAALRVRQYPLRASLCSGRE